MELVQRVGRGLDLRRAHIFQLDELVGVGPDDARSFHHLLREHFLSPTGHPAERTHLLDGAAADPAAEIVRHARDLEDLGGADLAVLGIGLNGHVAFNEPGSTLDSPARQLELAETTVRSMNGAFRDRETPRLGITLGLREIAASREVCVLATGASKADVLHALLTKEPTSALPASLLLSHPAVTVLTDEPARAHLQASS